MRTIVLLLLIVLFCGCESRVKSETDGNGEKVLVARAWDCYYQVRTVTVDGYKYVIIIGRDGCAICPAVDQPKTSVKE